MIKMQLIMDDEKMRSNQDIDSLKIHDIIDSYLLGNLSLRKAADGFYYGDGTSKDFARFGLAFNTLRKKAWFVENVKTWLYFNSDASANANDFVVEDMKEFCQEHRKAIA